MADTEQKEINPNTKHDRPRDKAIRALNKIMLLIFVVACLLVAYELFGFFGKYSKKQGELQAQGRIMNINTKTNKVALQDLTETQLEALGKNAQKAVEAAKVPEQTEQGPQPAATANKDQPQPPKPLDYNSANLAIIVTNVGMIQSQLDQAKTLPKEVTFAFSPYADDLQKKMDASAADGRQVLLNLMMQPSSFPVKDNGPLSIQLNYDDSTNAQRLNSALAVAKDYQGLLADSDEVVTAKIDKMTPILQKVSELNTFIGYFKNNNNLALENDAKPLAADIFGVDYLIDDNPGEENVSKVLNQVKEDLVLRKKRVVIALRPYPTSISTMKKWLDENLGANVQIAPISYFVTNN